MNEAKKRPKGLWHNIHQRRKKGLRPKRPGEKGYPKTLDIRESVLRSVIRREIMKEWGQGKITTGRVLSLLDPRGVVEGKRRRVTEAGEMFADMDLMQMQTTQVVNALETALMDLEDVGCPDGSGARVIIDQVIDMVEKMRNRPDYDTSMLLPMVTRAVHAVRTCKHIPPREAELIAKDIEMALTVLQEIDRY